MGLETFGLALVLALAAAAGSSVAGAALLRTREIRFLLLAAAQWGLLALGAIFAYGQIASAPPAFARAPTPIVGLTALVAVLLVLGSVLPRSGS